jgi:LysM repeat protein
MRYPDASVMRYPDASKPWDPRAKQNGPPLSRRVPQITGAAAAQSGQLPPPANAAAAAGNSPLNVPQAAMVVGEPIPVLWGRRRGNVGGVLIFPKATDARFENTSTTITSSYHMVLADGRLPDIQRKDVRLGACRIGDFSQNYDKRAGSWTPGNVATAQAGYTVPTFPNYTGGGGNYQGLSTFEGRVTLPGGSNDWSTAWNIFMRGGTIVERGRLLDSTVDSSDNIADLVLWALQRSGRVPDGMIDFPSLLSAATFTEAVGLWCNGEFGASTNLGDWLIRILPDFLLRETKVGGRFGIRPLLPINANGTINTGSIEPEWMLSEGAIVPDSYQIEYSDAASRRPVVMAMLWRQQHDDTDVPIVRTLTVGDPNASGPVEQHDLSQFATTENHAVKVGAYLYARRTLSTHTATVRLKPGLQTGTISEGDILQIYLGVTTSRESPGVINRYYQVENIGHSLTGEETLQLSHFPVDAEGRSLIALAVANATGPGIILTSNRTGSSCDLAGAASSTEVPAKTTIGEPLFPQGSSIDVPLGPSPDSPPGPGGGGSPQGSPGNPFGALPRPDPPTNPAGGDPICPTGYATFNPESYTYWRVTGTVAWERTSESYYVLWANSNSLSPQRVAWPGQNKVCIVPPAQSVGGQIVIYAYVNKSIPLADVVSNDLNSPSADVGSTQPSGCYTGRTVTYEFSNSNSAGAPILATWSGNSNISTNTQNGYICNDGTVGTMKLRTVVKGDTLWDIAQDEYGDPTRWPEIYAANTDVVGADPNLIFPGQVLRIPA